jgi:hypothetical protein
MKSTKLITIVILSLSATLAMAGPVHPDPQPDGGKPQERTASPASDKAKISTKINVGSHNPPNFLVEKKVDVTSHNPPNFLVEKKVDVTSHNPPLFKVGEKAGVVPVQQPKSGQPKKATPAAAKDPQPVNQG